MTTLCSVAHLLDRLADHCEYAERMGDKGGSAEDADEVRDLARRIRSTLGGGA